MTQREIIYNIREKLKLNSDDVDVSDEYLAHLINIKRVFLVKQRFSKTTRNIPEELKQIICVPLESSSIISEDPCFGDILVSSIKIPSSIEIGGRNSLIAIRVKDILYPHINIISTERLPYVGYNKWLLNQLYVALDADQRLYFKSNNPMHLNLESVKVLGVFSNPEEADKLKCDDSVTCEFYDKEYPIEPYLVHDLVNLIVKEVGTTLDIQNDNINNADGN